MRREGWRCPCELRRLSSLSRTPRRQCGALQTVTQYNVDCQRGKQISFRGFFSLLVSLARRLLSHYSCQTVVVEGHLMSKSLNVRLEHFRPLPPPVNVRLCRFVCLPKCQLTKQLQRVFMSTRIYVRSVGFFSLSTFIFFHLSCLLCAHCFNFLFFLFSPLLFFVCFVFSCFFCFVLLFISFFSFKFSVFVSPVSMVVRCRANRYTIRGVCVLRGRAADQNAFARRKPRCFFHFTHQTTFLFIFFIFFFKTGVFYRSSSSLRRKLFSN